MNVHINNTVRSCCFQLRATAKIRKYVSYSSIIKLCHAFITSRLDKLNSLLVNISNCMLHKLQLVQNSTARVILKLSRQSNITPALIVLHWLPFPERIHCNILLLVYKSINHQGLSYLADMLTPYQPSRAHRSSLQHFLNKKKTNKKYWERAFAGCGPALCNNLPLFIRQSESVEIFKSNLKTFLFKPEFQL